MARFYLVPAFLQGGKQRELVRGILQGRTFRQRLDGRVCKFLGAHEDSKRGLPRLVKSAACSLSGGSGETLCASVQPTQNTLPRG